MLVCIVRFHVWQQIHIERHLNSRISQCDRYVLPKDIILQINLYALVRFYCIYCLRFVSRIFDLAFMKF